VGLEVPLDPEIEDLNVRSLHPLLALSLALIVALAGGLTLAAGTSGCRAVKTCKIKEVHSDGGVDAFVPWWDASTCDASVCGLTNECGGEGVLAIQPGEPCGNCGGSYVCDGPNAVRCSDPCSDLYGCSDGEREGFLDATSFPDIAACSGGWSEKGILDTAPLCSRISGDDSQNPEGIECSAADLCAEGWRVCASVTEFAAASPGGCDGGFPAGTFYAAAVSGPGGGECNDTDTDDLFGCGTDGGGVDASCAPLERTSGDQCDDLSGEWDCPGSWLFGSDTEAEDVRKNGPGGGGVLCCRIQETP